MDDLVQFLRDRLDEDERTARAAGGSPWEASVPNMVHVSAAAQRESRALRSAGYVASTEEAEVQRHIARHDPARVLREVEAKRQITECHESWVAGNGDTICGRCGREHIDGRPGGHFPCQTLRLLALPYADHPDYRSEWAR